MTDSALTLWVSCRRDAILLTALAVGVATWAWAQSPWLLLAGGIICTLLYTAAVSVVRHAQSLEKASAWQQGKWTLPLWIAVLLLSGVAPIVLLSAATWDVLGQPVLALAVAALLSAWQVWFYFWMGD
jgi:hypothetical protein